MDIETLREELNKAVKKEVLGFIRDELDMEITVRETENNHGDNDAYLVVSLLVEGEVFVKEEINVDEILSNHHYYFHRG